MAFLKLNLTQRRRRSRGQVLSEGVLDEEPQDKDPNSRYPRSAVPEVYGLNLHPG